MLICGVSSSVFYFCCIETQEAQNSKVAFSHFAAEIVIHSVSWSKVLQSSLDGLLYTLLAWNTVGGYWNINVFHFKVY